MGWPRPRSWTQGRAPDQAADQEARPDGRGNLKVNMVRKIIVVGLLAVGMVAGVATTATAAPSGDFTVIGHRGGYILHSRITENSIKALDRAADNGATAAETDVRMTKNHKYLLMHDASLARTTRSTGKVAARTSRFINRRVRLNDGQRVPYLGQFLHEARLRGLNVLVEIKPDPRWTMRWMQGLVQEVAARGMTSRVRFLSFDANLLRMATAAGSPDQTVWIACHTPTVEQAESLGVTSVAVRADMIVADPTLVTDLTAAGLKVEGREDNVAADWQTYADAGITDVLTDATPQRVSWLEGQAQ